MKVSGFLFEELTDEDCATLTEVSEQLILTRFPPNPLPECILMWAKSNDLEGDNLYKMLTDVFA